MNGIQLPVSIKTERLAQPKVEIYYPSVTGLMNISVEHRINRAIFYCVHQIIACQGYQQHPRSEMTGWFEVKNNQRGILSLCLSNLTYACGAHGLTVTKSLTFDMQTGKCYRLRDLFEPESSYVSQLSTLIHREILDRDIKTLDEFKNIHRDQDFYIADQSLVIYFQFCALTAYAQGMPHFPISIYEIKDIIFGKGPLGRMLNHSIKKTDSKGSDSLKSIKDRGG